MSVTSIPKKIAHRAIRSLGYEVCHASKTLTNSIHSRVIPRATYSPWNTDERFKSVFKTVSANTLVDKYRCYELWSLIEQSAKLSGAILEVGVWRGGTGALMAKKAELCGIHDPIYLCDTFQGVVKAGSADSFYKGGEHANTSRQIVEQLVRDRMGLKNVQILEGIFPDQTADQIPPTSFRLCHVDVDVYESAKGVVDWVWDKLVPGGIVVYDDYGFPSCPGITRYVNEQRDQPDRLVIHNLNGHAIVIKMDPGHERGRDARQD